MLYGLSQPGAPGFSILRILEWAPKISFKEVPVNAVGLPMDWEVRLWLTLFYSPMDDGTCEMDPYLKQKELPGAPGWLRG